MNVCLNVKRKSNIPLRHTRWNSYPYSMAKIHWCKKEKSFIIDALNPSWRCVQAYLWTIYLSIKKKYMDTTLNFHGKSLIGFENKVCWGFPS